MTPLQGYRIDALWIRAFSICCIKTCGKNVINKIGFIRVMLPILEQMDKDKKALEEANKTIAGLQRLVSSYEIADRLIERSQQSVATLETVAANQ